MKDKIYRIVLKDKPRKIYAKSVKYTFKEAENLRKKCVKMGYKKAYIVLEEEKWLNLI